MAVSSISKREWRWVFVWSALIVFITTLPVLVAWWQTPVDWHYTGQILAPADGNSYLTKMKQGAEGQWLFSIAYTSEPHQPAFLFSYYLLLGKLSRLVGLSLNVTFQLFRILNSWLLLVVIYLFIAQFWRVLSKRRIAFLFVAVSSGLGWIFIFLDIPTVDIRVTESITFVTMLANPHFPLATALILLSLLWGMRALQYGVWKYVLLCGLAQTVLLLIHPYDIAVTGATLVIYAVWGWRIRGWWSWQRCLFLGLSWLICLPVFLYILNLFLQPQIWRSWQTQPLFSPTFLNVTLGYGLLIILAVVGGYSLFQKDKDLDTERAKVLLIWIITVLVSIFIPLSLIKANQVRFLEGFHIPVALLAAQGLFMIWTKKSNQSVPPVKLWLPILIFLSLTNGLILASAVYRMKVFEPPWFYKQNEVTAMRWLNHNAQSSDVVLTLDWTGNYLPAQANVHVYVGHIYETVDFSTKLDEATSFFSNQLSEPEAIDFLQHNSVDWVFAGNQELEAGFEPTEKPYLIKSYELDNIVVYKVKQP